MDARRRAALALSCFYASLSHPLRVTGSTNDPERLWHGSAEAIARRLHLSANDTGLLAAFQRGHSHKLVVEKLKRKRVSMLAFGDDGYPELLAGICDPPLALFIAGETARLKEFMDQPRIAVVGSRAATSYGIDAAHLLAAGLARNNVCIVSGMALGVDAKAHEAALPEQGGTIAVLASGPDTATPRANAAVYKAIIERGLVISEYPPGTRPLPWRFPARNRVIAGLSDGVIVVEAAERSGALITAEFGLEAGREVFAVPGSIFERASGGTNRLIQSGAAAVLSPDDVLEALGFRHVGRENDVKGPTQDGMTDGERRLVNLLGARPVPVDILAMKSGIDVAAALALLTALELRGIVRFEPGRGYSR